MAGSTRPSQRLDPRLSIVVADFLGMILVPTPHSPTQQMLGMKIEAFRPESDRHRAHAPHSRERAYSVISDADMRNVGSDCGHDSCDFVPKHRRWPASSFCTNSAMCWPITLRAHRFVALAHWGTSLHSKCLSFATAFAAAILRQAPPPFPPFRDYRRDSCPGPSYRTPQQTIWLNLDSCCIALSARWHLHEPASTQLSTEPSRDWGSFLISISPN
jgi:hypothetical protein